MPGKKNALAMYSTLIKLLCYRYLSGGQWKTCLPSTTSAFHTPLAALSTWSVPTVNTDHWAGMTL